MRPSLDTATWDLAEPHVWLSEGGLFQPLSGQLGALLCLPGMTDLIRV